MKRIIVVFLSVALLLFGISASALDAPEDYNAISSGYAGLYDNVTQTGKITSSGQQQIYEFWYPSQDGYANLWMGVPSGYDYTMKLYNSSWTELASATVYGTNRQIFRYWINPNQMYYVKVYSPTNMYSSTQSYQIKLRRYENNTMFCETYSFVGSLSDVKYYVSYDLSSYSSQIASAASSWVTPWNGATNTYSLTNMSVASYINNANFRFLNDSSSSMYGLRALTVHYTDSSCSIKAENDSSDLVNNWAYCKVLVNKNQLVSEGFSSTQIQGIMAHEFGHCFGAYHNNGERPAYFNEANLYSIMSLLDEGRMTYWPEVFDTRGFNARY